MHAYTDVFVCMNVVDCSTSVWMSASFVAGSICIRQLQLLVECIICACTGKHAYADRYAYI